MSVAAATGVNTCITWSNLELRGLLEDEDARVRFERANRHLALHPFHLNDLNRAVREILDANINSYVDELHGLVLAYKKPKLLGPLGAILHDSHFIHVDVQADFYIFKPEIGCILKGIANKKAASHIGVLVHKAFNVSVPKPEDCEEWLGDYVFVGQEVKFTVTHLDFKGKLPFIRGDLISDGISHSTFNNGDAVDADAPEENTVDEAEEKRAKKSVRLFISSEDETKQNGEVPEEKSKVERPANGKKKHFFDSSVEESSEDEQRQSRESRQKQRRVSSSSESSESEGEPKQRTKTKNTPEKLSKVNGHPEARTGRPESVDKKPKVKALKVEKPAKKNPPSSPLPQEAEISDASDEPEAAPVDRKRKVNSVKVEKPAKKNPSLPLEEAESSDASDEPEAAPVDRTPKVNSVKVEESPKKKKKKRSIANEESPDASSVDSSTVEKSPKKKPTTELPAESEIDEKPRINELLKVEKSTKKKHARVDSSTVEKSPKKKPTTESPAESEIDEKPRINELSKIEKSTKKKHARVEIATSTPKSSAQQVDAKFAVDRLTTQAGDAEEDFVASQKKATKKNRVIESDNDDTADVAIKSETSPKKKKSKKHRQEESDNEDTADVAIKSETSPKTKTKSKKHREVEESREDTFEFVKPEVKPELKKKRRKSVAENAESTESASDFFQDVRIKVEPPSDVEDAAATAEKRTKRKRKHSATVKEEASRSGDAADEETSNFIPTRNVGIKVEPDASDVEDAKPRKKKSKKRQSDDGNSFEHVRVKAEPNASDVEDATTPKKRVKSEPVDKKVRINFES